MKSFKEFGIKTNVQHLKGEKIKITRILNKEILITDFKIEDSKHNANKCLYLEFTLNGKEHICFTGSTGLLEQIQQVPKSDFPFTATIIEENDRYLFS